jgi:hypothetical protein
MNLHFTLQPRTIVKLAIILVMVVAIDQYQAKAQNIHQTSTGDNSANVVGNGNKVSVSGSDEQETDKDEGQKNTPTTKPADKPSDPPSAPPPNKSTVNPRSTVYTPTSEQLKDLRIAQLEAVNIQQVYANRAQQLPEYQQFQQAMIGLKQACAKVREANHWPVDVDCDPNTNPMTFGQVKQAQVPAPAPTPTPAPTPAPAKKDKK